MNTKILNKQSLSIIDQYTNFKISGGSSGPMGNDVSVNVPYYNNKRVGLRSALRAEIGKGSPREIYDEVLIKSQSSHITPSSFTSSLLKEFMVKEGVGIDCSGFVYHVLNAESLARNNTTIDRHMHFPFAGNIFRKIRAKMRPVENTDVVTFASDKNSHVVSIKEIMPGDFISMIGNGNNSVRDHIVVIHQVEYQNFLPSTIHYSHSIAYPTDGEYGHGVRQGTIEIVFLEKDVTEAVWGEPELLSRAKQSKTEIRRLNQF
jgi:hypothetical protein